MVGYLPVIRKRVEYLADRGAEIAASVLLDACTAEPLASAASGSGAADVGRKGELGGRSQHGKDGQELHLDIGDWVKR